MEMTFYFGLVPGIGVTLAGGASGKGSLRVLSTPFLPSASTRGHPQGTPCSCHQGCGTQGGGGAPLSKLFSSVCELGLFLSTETADSGAAGGRGPKAWSKSLIHWPLR